jgi:hypothetical protein
VEINRGQILENYLRSNGINLTELAESLPWTVRTMYRHFETPDLSLEKLLEYAKVVQYDFSDQVPEMNALKFRLAEPPSGFKSKERNGVTEAEYYRDKYEKLLEKYNELLEIFNQGLRISGDNQAK